MTIDWIAELDEKQLEAVTYGTGPLKVIAGAGSGKTRTLMYRAAHLQLEQNVSAEDLLLMTFTKAATVEMEERAAKMMGGKTGMQIATQHSWAIRSLRPYSGNGELTLLGCCDLSFSKNGKRQYPLLTDSFYMDAWKKAAKNVRITNDVLPHYEAASIVSRAKNCLVTREQLLASKDADARNAAVMWKAYEEYCMIECKMDFDDTLVLLADMLENPGVAIQLQHRHPWVLVDECQDLSPVQWKIIELLCPAPGANLTIVGDDDQSIYGFRGAEPDKLINFEQKYDAKVVKLEQNYRSTKDIVSQATSLIKRNDERQEKTPFSLVEHERQPVVFVADTDQLEAQGVAEQIKAWIDLGYEYGDIAVLVRCWWQTRPFEETFIFGDIPYVVWGGSNFYQRKEIAMISRYFRLAINPTDDEALMGTNLASSILNFPLRYMGRVAYDQLEAEVNRGTTARQALDSCNWSKPYMARSAKELSETIDMLHAWYAKNKPSSADLLRHIEMVLDLERYVVESFDNSEDRVDNLRALYGVAENHPQPIEFAAHMMKMQEPADKPDEAKNAVQVLTIHRAKGREWPCVAAVGFADGVLPHFKASKSSEERRLAYVAVTRAERELMVSGARMYRERECDVSFFVSELGFTHDDVEEMFDRVMRERLELLRVDTDVERGYDDIAAGMGLPKS